MGQILKHRGGAERHGDANRGTARSAAPPGVPAPAPPGTPSLLRPPHTQDSVNGQLSGRYGASKPAFSSPPGLPVPGHGYRNAHAASPRRIAPWAANRPNAGTKPYRVAARRNHPSGATVRIWLGITCVLLSGGVAMGTVVGPYYQQQRVESDNRAFLAGLAQFGPTPTPLATRTVPIAQAVPSDTSIPALLPPQQPFARSAPPPISPVQTPSPPRSLSIAHPPLTHISIPPIGVEARIVEVGPSPTRIDGQEVSIWDVPAHAVGHHTSSAHPGEGRNVVLNGHNDLQGEVFRDLWRLQKGSKITVQAGDKTWHYHVETMLALQEIGTPLEQRLDNALYIGDTNDERLTLITCWPYGINDHRLIVIARPD